VSSEKDRTLREQKEKLAEQDLRAQAQVKTLLNANPQAVPAILEGLKNYQKQVRPGLREARALPEPAHSTEAARRRWLQHRTRAALALLPEDSGQLPFLKQRLLATDVEPEEMLLIRDCLLPHKAELAKELWADVDHRGRKEGGRFRALVALAAFDPHSPRWKMVARDAVGPLLTAEPLHVAVWSKGLAGVRDSLIGPLTKVFHDRQRPNEKRLAATVLRGYAGDRPALLADLLMDADLQQFLLLLPKLREHADKAVALLHLELERPWPPPAVDEQERDRQAQRRANAAAALLHLGQPARVWPLLRMSAYPDVRTHLYHRSGWLNADPRLLCERLGVETDDSARQALILALGEYTTEQLPASLRQEWTGQLLKWYGDNPDPGVHAAIDWLLRPARDGPLPRKHVWGQGTSKD
jgi:hypothetical protein